MQLTKKQKKKTIKMKNTDLKMKNTNYTYEGEVPKTIM